MSLSFPILHGLGGDRQKATSFLFTWSYLCAKVASILLRNKKNRRVLKVVKTTMEQQTNPNSVIQITLNRKEASMLEESLDHCYRMFGGNDLEYDEMIIDVRRQITSKNNIRELNIV